MRAAGQQTATGAGEPTAAVETMRAVVQNTYGQDAADVLRLEEIDRPAVGDDDVLIRGRAAGVHIGDWHVMTDPAEQVPDAIGYLHAGRARGRSSSRSEAQTPHQRHPSWRGPGLTIDASTTHPSIDHRQE